MAGHITRQTSTLLGYFLSIQAISSLRADVLSKPVHLSVERRGFLAMAFSNDAYTSLQSTRN